MTPTGIMIRRVEGNGAQRITYTQGFDAEGRLAVVTHTVTGEMVRLVYDGDGKRVLRIGPEGTTVYMGDYYEREGSTVCKDYYAAGSASQCDKGARSPICTATTWGVRT